MRIHLIIPAAALTATLCCAAVIDRVAVVIDKTIITESEVLDELRLTEFLNDQPPDFGPAARRAAADHLVDQELIRRELQNSGYPKPSANEADALLRKFRQQRFRAAGAYTAALAKYGITENQLKERLLWQEQAIHFTDLRFRSQSPENASQSADRAAPGTPTASVDQQMETWLKHARADSKIAFKPEAFQ